VIPVEGEWAVWLQILAGLVLAAPFAVGLVAIFYLEVDRETRAIARRALGHPPRRRRRRRSILGWIFEGRP